MTRDSHGRANRDGDLSRGRDQEADNGRGSPPDRGTGSGSDDTSATVTDTAERIGTVSGQESLADQSGTGERRSVETGAGETGTGETGFVETGAGATGSVETGAGATDAEETGRRDRSRSGRTRGMEIVAAGLIAIGIVTGTAEAFLMSVPLVLGIVYHRVTELPNIDLEVSRDFSQVSVVPGETVTVAVTVTNRDESSIPDLRIRDDVPERLSVVEGTPMASVSLEPGGAATLSYEVTARRGVHEFRGVEVICRNASGSERERQILAAPRTLVAESSLAGMPLSTRASQYTGRLETSFRGSGVEFHSTREYHPSDSPRDIDWRTFAKTRDFTTIEYKDTRAASIHLVVDSRAATQEHTGANAVTSRELCLYAGEQVAEYLIADRHQIGVSIIGDGAATHLPEKSPRQYRRVRREFASGADDEEVGESGTGFENPPADVVDETAADVGDETLADVEKTAADAVDQTLADELVANTASHTQFVCFCGLYDDGFDAFLHRLAEHDRPVLVVSPRHELVSTPGSQLTALERHVRIETLRRKRVRVLDWDTDEPLRLAIQRRVGGLWE